MYVVEGEGGGVVADVVVAKVGGGSGDAGGIGKRNDEETASVVGRQDLSLDELFFKFISSLQGLFVQWQAKILKTFDACV